MMNSKLSEQDASLDDEAIGAIVRSGPSGAVVLAGLATAIVLALWFAFYFFVFLPRVQAQ